MSTKLLWVHCYDYHGGPQGPWEPPSVKETGIGSDSVYLLNPIRNQVFIFTCTHIRTTGTYIRTQERGRYPYLMVERLFANSDIFQNCCLSTKKGPALFYQCKFVVCCPSNTVIEEG